MQKICPRLITKDGCRKEDPNLAREVVLKQILKTFVLFLKSWMSTGDRKCSPPASDGQVKMNLKSVSSRRQQS